MPETTKRSGETLTIAQFAAEIGYWYDQYKKTAYYVGDVQRNIPGSPVIEEYLSAKAKKVGYLDLGDLKMLALWGGDERGRAKHVEGKNTPSAAIYATKSAISHLNNPDVALRKLLCLKQWGLSYASKTLRFIDPLEYGALDSWIRKATESIIGQIRDGDENSMVRGYLRFIDLCKRIQKLAVAQNPRNPETAGVWFIADIEDALYEFARYRNLINDGLTNANQHRPHALPQ